jgi:hypothetical protein
MKKIIYTAVAVFGFAFANAQSTGTGGGQTAKGKILIEANTGFGSIGAGAGGFGATAFGFSSQDGSSIYNIGAEAGYFVMDNLALKVGLGFGGDSPKEGDGTTFLGYKLGAKYYIMGMIPVAADFYGVKPSEGDAFNGIGFQGGYAIFLGDNVSLEPGIRYNHLLEEGAKGVLQFNVGFALHF